MMNYTSCLSLWERWLSEAGEGKQVCKALSVTFGDCSPGGRAKGLSPYLGREMERICTDTLHSLFYDHPLKRLAFLHIVHYSIIWIQPLGASRRPIWMPVRVS